MAGRPPAGLSMKARKIRSMNSPTALVVLKEVVCVGQVEPVSTRWMPCRRYIELYEYFPQIDYQQSNI